jgi:hypothetical protein
MANISKRADKKVRYPGIIGRAGDRAYYDGISGLVPCLVLHVTLCRIRVRMCAAEGVLSWHGINEYGHWDSIEVFSHHELIPAKAVKMWKHSYHPTVLPYQWEEGGSIDA